MRLADYFDAAAEQHPQNLAFVDGATRVNLDQAQKTVHAMANALVRAKRADAGCHVAIYSPNDYRVTLLHLGINLADMAWLSVHIRNTVETNAEVLDYFDANIVFFHSHFESSVPSSEGQAFQSQTLHLH